MEEHQGRTEIWVDGDSSGQRVDRMTSNDDDINECGRNIFIAVIVQSPQLGSCSPDNSPLKPPTKIPSPPSSLSCHFICGTTERRSSRFILSFEGIFLRNFSGYPRWLPLVIYPRSPPLGKNLGMEREFVTEKNRDSEQLP